MRSDAFSRAMLAAAVLLGLSLPAVAQEKGLASVKTDAAPAIDGKRDEAWAKAKPVTIELSKLVYSPANYKGEQKTAVTLSSLYDNESIYILAQWKDSSQSLEQQPWVKQADGSWKQKRDLDDTGRENQFAEDKLALLWNINTAGFETRGCAAVCHRGRGGKISGVADNSPGRKFTDKAGETVDMWLWKAVRSNPVGQVDDGFIDDTHDPAKNAEWGRKNDSGGGGFVDNVNADKSAPAFMSTGSTGKGWVLEDQKAPFADTFKAGDMVGSLIGAALTGSRGDITGAATWENGTWTLEIKRKLVTTGEGAKQQDVQFEDRKKSYFFGVSVFDHTDSAHMYHEGSVKLTFN